MSTRGACGFRVDGKDKITYNHSDSYPDYLGVNVLFYARETSVERMGEIARGIIMVQSTVKPTPEQIKDCLPYYGGDISKHSPGDWYWLLRAAQGDLAAYERGLKYMIDDQSFLGDSGSCKWAYVINLDEGVFEVYKGLQKERSTNRYYQFADLRSAYGNCRLVAVYPLRALPSESKFLEDMRREAARTSVDTA